MAVQRIRVRVTPPIRNPDGTIQTPGELKVQEIAPDGTVVGTWPQSLIDSIADMRIAARPSGDSRVRILFEAGLEALQVDGPLLDNL